MLRKRVGYIALFSCTAILSLATALGAITSFSYQEKVLPRTLVAGVEIGNLPYPQAEQKIQDRAAELAGLKVTLTLKDKSANASLSALGVKVSPDSAIAQTIRPNRVFDWLTVSYWRAMFRPKSIALGFQADPSVLRKNVETTLGVTTAAQDATISYDGGQLVVHDSQKGLSVSETAVTDAIATVLTTGAPTATTLTFAESDPVITTDIATQTKTEITQRFTPIHLTTGDQSFTITPNSEYSFLDFSPVDGKLAWRVSTDKIKSYLNSAIAAKVNVKMLPKTTMSDTGQVTQEGRDGKQADINRLAADIAQTITKQTDTTSSPIAINIATIAFTEKTIYPNYIANLFPGLYADVNLSTQQMFILNGQTLISTYLVSTGMAGLRTPPGQYYVCNKIPLARSPLYKSLWMPTWNALSTSPTSCGGYVGYGVHGLPCFNSTCTLVESPLHLGRPVSHGCVRLPDDGARWFYDNMPIGTPVNIHY